MLSETFREYNWVFWDVLTNNSDPPWHQRHHQSSYKISLRTSRSALRLAWLSTLTSDQAFCFFFSSHWSKITTILIGLICYSALKQNRKQRRTISQPGGLSIASGRQFKRVKCLLELYSCDIKQSMCRPNMRKQSTDDWLLQTLTSSNAVIRPAWYQGRYRVQGTPLHHIN